MEVVETFKLVLGLRHAIAKRDQLDVVLQHMAETGKRVRNTKIIFFAAFVKDVATEANVEKSCDGTCVRVGKRNLRKKTPTIFVRSLHDILSKRVTDRPRSSLWFDRNARWSRNDHLPDCIKR